MSPIGSERDVGTVFPQRQMINLRTSSEGECPPFHGPASPRPLPAQKVEDALCITTLSSPIEEGAVAFVRRYLLRDRGLCWRGSRAGSSADLDAQQRRGDPGGDASDIGEPRHSRDGERGFPEEPRGSQSLRRLPRDPADWDTLDAGQFERRMRLRMRRSLGAGFGCIDRRPGRACRSALMSGRATATRRAGSSAPLDASTDVRRLSRNAEL